MCTPKITTPRMKSHLLWALAGPGVESEHFLSYFNKNSFLRLIAAGYCISNINAINWFLVPNCPLLHNGAKLSMVPNCPRCQIVHGAKLSTFTQGAKLTCCQNGRGAKLSTFTYGAKLSTLHYGAKLSVVPNCPAKNGGYMSVGYMYWYWIYTANNWRIPQEKH